MYLKLAFRNVRRSMRDYAIYFVTLLFGVAVYYAFNSIGSQQVLFDLESEASERQFQSMSQLLGMFSIVIAFVLGFLILYANRFLIRRRKREFGTYLLLGMSAGRVSRIVLYETVMVGVLSLAAGLAAGVALSQGLSFLTAALFGTTMSNYQFVFSADAFMATLACFAVIYAIVAVFNTLSVNRYKLIDLIRADQKSERPVVRNPKACLAVFVVSVAVLAFAYMRLIESEMFMMDDPRFIQATVAMFVGTLLFFWSLAGFVIAVVTHLRKFYLRGLRMFTVRQIASKVNTAFVSLWAVCVLLFFSITTFSCGMGLVEVFTGGVEEANPYSATLDGQIWYGPGGDAGAAAGDPLTRRAEMAAEAPERLAQAESCGWNMEEPLRVAAPEAWDETVRASAQATYYSIPDITYGPLIDAALAVDPGAMDALGDADDLPDTHLMCLSISEVNALAALIGAGPFELEADEFAIANNMELSAPLAEAMVRVAPSIDAVGHELAMAHEIIDIQLDDNAMLSTALVLVVPDEVTADIADAGVIPERTVLNVMYAENGRTAAENDEALDAIVAAAQPASMGGFDKGTAGAGEGYASLLWPVTRIMTANEMLTQSGGLRLLITYLALYIGFIFLMSTAALLAIQQLSEASDSAPRYRALWKLGCDRRMLNRSLLAQVAIYFLAPLALAVCHSACAIGVLSDALFDALGVPVAGPIALAAGLTVAIYGGYFLITYLASRNIVAIATKAG